jgi:hypothetical protein
VAQEQQRAESLEARQEVGTLIFQHLGMQMEAFQARVMVKQSQDKDSVVEETEEEEQALLDHFHLLKTDKLVLEELVSDIIMNGLLQLTLDLFMEAAEEFLQEDTTQAVAEEDIMFIMEHHIIKIMQVLAVVAMALEIHKLAIH